MWMRGGTSKGGYFLAADLPADRAARDALLLRIIGSPDARQIDGMGGGDPLTSKLAIISPSTRDNCDVDYLFLQVFPDRALVTDAQNCGNILAGVGPFAIERGLVPAGDGQSDVRIYMENTGQSAVARVQTPKRQVSYQGGARIDGVPGQAAPIAITFEDTAGSSCGALFPTGQGRDRINGMAVTLIDNGMPCVLMRAADFGLSGNEPPEVLEANAALRQQLEDIRLIAGPMMNLGDVTDKSVPKMTLLSAPQQGGAITSRSFIPHRCHKAVGVLGAVSIATACLSKGTVAQGLAVIPQGAVKHISVEHPSGEMTVVGHMDASGGLARSDVLRTARKLMDGLVF